MSRQCQIVLLPFLLLLLIAYSVQQGSQGNNTNGTGTGHFNSSSGQMVTNSTCQSNCSSGHVTANSTSQSSSSSGQVTTNSTSHSNSSSGQTTTNSTSQSSSSSGQATTNSTSQSSSSSGQTTTNSTSQSSSSSGQATTNSTSQSSSSSGQATTNSTSQSSSSSGQTTTNSTSQSSSSSGQTTTNSTSQSSSSSGQVTTNSTNQSNSSSGQVTTNSTSQSNSSSGQATNNSTNQSNSSSGQVITNSTSQSNSSSGQVTNNSTNQSNSSSGQVTTNSTSQSNSSSGQVTNNSTNQSNSSSGQVTTNSTSQSNSSSGQVTNNSTNQSNSSSGQVITNSTSQSNSSSGQITTNSTSQSNSSSGQVTNNSTSQSNSSSVQVTNNSTSQSNSSSGQVITNSTSQSNSSSGQVITNSTSQSNSSSGQVITNSTSQSNSSSGQVITNSTSQSNSSSGQVITNSTSQSNSSSGQVITNSTSQSNSSSEWNFTNAWSVLTFYREDLHWSLAKWWSFFMRAENMTVTNSHWDYQAWYNYFLSIQELEYSKTSLVETESAVILNIFESLAKKTNERATSCVSLLESINLVKSILAKRAEQIDEDFDSSSRALILHYTTSAQMSDYKITQRFVCSSYEDSSKINPDGDEEDGQTCDLIKQRDSLLAFIRLEISWDNNNAGCSEASLAIESIEAAQESCSWEVRSALSLLVSQKRAFWFTMCSPSTCNIPYADISLSSALMVLEDFEEHKQNVTENTCKILKLALATALNHTIDCQRNIYSSISRKIELVKNGYLKHCGTLPAEPKPCVEAKLNTDIFSSLAASFFFDRTTVCQVAKIYNTSYDSLGHYCDKNNSSSLMSCYANSCNNSCDNSSRLNTSQFLVARACLTANGISNFTLRKMDTFNAYLRRYFSADGNHSTCVDHAKFEQLSFNATQSILTGETDPLLCLHAKDDINQLFVSCGSDESYLKSNMTALFSLVCPKTMQLPGCDNTRIIGCFAEISTILSNKERLQNLNQCVEQSNCSGPFVDEARETARLITAASAYLYTENNSVPCTCDPAQAVNCIMNVHHMSKQITPDWIGLCPKVAESENCARSYVEGCDECKKSTVLEIVHKLNRQLEDTCISPPVTECSAVSAMQCVTELAHFQESSNGFGNDTICIKITIASQCVYEKTEKCDELTTLSIMHTLEQVIFKWKNLQCQSPEDQLKNCSSIFESRVYEVFGMNMYALMRSVQNNETTLWNKFTHFCEEINFSFECMNASLSLQGDVQAAIVRQVLEALFKSVTKVCNPPQGPLQCYSCQGDGQNSCAKGRSIKTCNDKEICETTTSVFQNGSKVTERGCIPRASCKAGCDEKGCTYCCSDNLCNSRDEGPIEGTCNMNSVAKCVFSLIASYNDDDNFQCSAASAAVECINKEHTECELGGITTVMDSFRQLKLSVSADIHKCLIGEADQTCSIMPFAATIGYISQTGLSQFPEEDICMIIDQSRSRVSQAKSVCTKDQYLFIQWAQNEVEAVIGYLDCKEKFNFTIDIVCKPFESLVCLQNFSVHDHSSLNETCLAFNEMAKCMKAKLVNCSSAVPLLYVENNVQWLVTSLHINDSCTDVKLVENSNITLTEVEKCLKILSSKMKLEPISGLVNATLTLQSCISSINESVIQSLSIKDKLALEMIIELIREIIEMHMEDHFHLDMEIPETCSANLTALFYNHSVVFFGIPFISLDKRAWICRELDSNLVSVTSNCDMNATADFFKALDILRVNYLTGFCPEIKPIPRCLISRAEECYVRIAASFSLGDSNSMCLEADEFIKCAETYTKTCNYTDLKGFRKKAAFIADFVSQACANNPDLIAKANCALMGRVESHPGCINDGIQQCTNTQKDKCNEAESRAACIIENAGTCPETISSTILRDSLSVISQCRFGDDSHSTDESLLTHSCSSKSYTCDVEKSKSCLYSLLNQSYNGDIESQTRTCLEQNFYCFTPFSRLISTDMQQFYTLIVHIRNLSPYWNQMESKYLIEWLKLTNYFFDFFTPNQYVSLQLWDMCWELSEFLEDIQEINITFSNEALPITKTSSDKIRMTISHLCNNLGDVAEELQLPPDGIENPACPVDLTTAYVYVLISQAITDFFSAQNFIGESVCSLYNSLNQSLEANAEASLSFTSCSSGFSAKVQFAMKIVHSFLGNRCQMSNNDVKRCDFELAKGCVHTLYQNFMSLGINQTIPGLCKISEETETCVHKYSYKCDSSTYSRIQWMYRSTQMSVEQKCMSQISTNECEEEEDESDECNLGRATICSINQFKNFLNPFMDNDAKCRHLNENLNCISKATKNCTGIIPELINQSAEKVKNLLSNLHCNDYKVNLNTSCREGCAISKAYKCITLFKSQVTEIMEQEEEQTICRHINDLKMCIAQNTATCNESESKSVIQASEVILEEFSYSHDSCNDVVQCSFDFDNLVRQISNIKSEDDFDNEESDVEGDENDGSGGLENDDDEIIEPENEEEEDDYMTSSNMPSLNTLCIKAELSWSCLQKGLNLLPDKKKLLLLPLYTQIWETMQEKCSNTRELECFYCKDKDSYQDCETQTEICPHNKATCMFRQVLSGNVVEYTAGCSSATMCIEDEVDVETYYCQTSVCNKKANAADTCELESPTCRMDLSLNCALKLTSHYLVSESMNCSDITYNLGCIQSNAYGCKNSKNLIEAISKIFINIASTECVVNAHSNDCDSLAVNSMQSLLGSAYVTEDNSVCVALKDTTESINELLVGKTCSEDGKINLQVVFNFIHSIVGNFCSDDKCSEGDMKDYLKEKRGSCSRNIFDDGIINIYKTYIEIAKNDSDRDCGSSADYALSAQNVLQDCNISNFITNQLDTLYQMLESKCQIPAHSDLPKICHSVCQSSAVLTYTDEVNTFLTASNSYNRWYLSNLQKVYVSYTVGCTSIQQRDIVRYIQTTLGIFIAECKQKYSDFSFNLVIKEDIYYNAALCSDGFQNKFQSAFLENDQLKLCKAVDEFKACNMQLPDVVKEIVENSSQEILNFFEKEGICGDLGNSTNRTRRSATVCQIDLLSSLLATLTIPMNIPVTAIDSRNKYCQNIALTLEKATMLVIECSDGLSKFQQAIYNAIRKNVEAKNDKSCLPLYYETKECDFQKMVQCRLEYQHVSGFAATENDTLCRRAKFALECTQRYSMNCTNNDTSRATAIQETLTAVIKQSLGNSCPLLTLYLFCNKSVTEVKPACNLDVAKKCRNATVFDFTRLSDPAYCPELQKNVTCVQNAASGCQDNQIALLGWPVTPRNKMCNITDVSLNNVCISVPVCSTKPILACFIQAKPASCQSFQAAVTCMTKYLNSNKQCQMSLGNALIQHYLSDYYSILASTCGMAFNFSLPIPYKSSSVESLLTTIDIVLSYRKTYSAADILYYIYRVFAVEEFDMSNTIIAEMIKNTVLSIYGNNTDFLLRPTGQVIQYNQTDERYTDKDNCYYSRAKACLTSQIIRTYTFSLLTSYERNELCNDWSDNTVDTCITDALLGCADDKTKFLQIGTLSSLMIEHSQICEQPQVCLISEANQCITMFGTILSNFDHDNDSKVMCLGRQKSQECMDGYLFTCSADEAQPVRDKFKTLTAKVDTICQTVVLPAPPICPGIKERNRVCQLGNAFLCLANFNNKILMTSDSLIWRQQCLEIQKMMVCIATNTTSCDPENADVKIIINSLKDFKTAAGYRCPWLTDDMCEMEKPCPVMTSGCDVDMERKLMNKEGTVCRIKEQAHQCVDNYTTTCTQAQKLQAQDVINKKIISLGLPKELSCQTGSIDECLYSFLSAIGNIYSSSGKKENCEMLSSQYRYIVGNYSNTNKSQYLEFAKALIDRVYLILNATQCTASTANKCTTPIPVKKLKVLITQLALNDKFSNISLCAKSQFILQEKTTNDCNAALYSIITDSDVYKNNCANAIASCDNATVKIKDCVSKIGIFSSLSCVDKQRAANCITENLPANCVYDPKWLDGDLCNDTVVLQASGNQGKMNFLSECGLSLNVSYKLVAGSKQIKLRITFQPLNTSTVPCCLTGSQGNESIAQVYTGMNPQSLKNDSTINFIVKAVQDLRTDGPQTVIAKCDVIPVVWTINASSGEKVETELTNKTFTITNFTVHIEDCDQLKSECSAVNDPHIITFDGTAYSNMESGSYTLYRSTVHPEAVVIYTYQCATHGTCICGVTIFCDSSSVTFNICQKDMPFVAYNTKSGADTLDRQKMAIFIDELNTYKVISLLTGAIFTVENSIYYLQVYVIPSPLLIDNSQGLCGNYDNNTFNDLMMSNGSVYHVSVNDTEFGMLTPKSFNSAWKINNSDAQNSSKVFYPGVTLTSESDNQKCITVKNGSNEYIHCSSIAHIGICGLVNGEDQTQTLLALRKQDISTTSKRRKKRAAILDDTPTNDTALVNPGWPTKSGWTLNAATDYCMENLYNGPLQKCTEALMSVSLQPNYDSLLVQCVDNIRLSGTTDWTDGVIRAAQIICSNIVNQDPSFPNNKNSSDLAIAFMNTTCVPSNCSGHGQCFRGRCICDRNYTNTKCDIDISNLRPPVLSQPEDGLYLCEIGVDSDCSSIFLQGTNLVSSSLLSCHIRTVEITETGSIIDLKSSKETIVSAYQIATNQVTCNLGSKSVIKRTLQVSVSNDGKLPYENYQTFIAYDPVCYDCNYYSCRKRSNVCIIGNRCVQEGASSVYSDCQYCNLTNPNEWSSRLEIPGCENMFPDKNDNDSDKQTLITALIAVGCSLVVLLIILIALCVIIKRRDARRKREAARRNGAMNRAYIDDLPFHGQPVQAFQSTEWRDDNLLPPKYKT